jgi:low affinity Fe/Cu permease
MDRPHFGFRVGGTLALQLKVNELIAAQRGAHNALIAIDQLSEDELRELQARFARLAELGAREHAMSVLDIVDVPVDVLRNETE